MIRVVRRIAVLWLFLGATVALLAACGTSSQRAAHSASTPITATQALAYAHEVNLRAADVPGMTSRRNAEVVIYPRGATPFLHCAGIPAATPLLEIHSPIFNAPYWWMRSTVGVLPSATLAASYVSALGSPRDRRCFFARVPRSVHPTISTLAVSCPIIGFRKTENTGLSRQTHIDVFAFASGRAVVMLTAEGETMPPLATERRLASLLRARAEAHKV
jgi:hypothetical protein